MRSALVLALLPAILAHNAAEHPHVKHLRRSGGHVSHGVAARHAALAERQGPVAGVTGAVGSVIGGTDPDDDTDGPSTAPTTARTTLVPTTTTPTVNPPITTSSTSARISSTSSGTLTSSPSTSGTVSVSRSASASLNGTVSSTSTSNSSTSATSTSSSAQSISMSVDPAGKTVVITQFLTASTSSSSSASSSASVDAGNADVNQKQNNSISTGAIIGIAVGVGAVIIALIACAVWRMRRRAMDEDDAIRWPELNRHGDATVHHALPARVTGKHGIETDPLERVASHNSDTYDHSSLGHGHSHGPTPMALNGSSFGAPSTLDYNAYDEKAQGAGYDWRGQGSYGGYPISDATVPTLPGAAAVRGSPPDLDDDYTSFPPATTAATQHPGAAGLYESPSDDDLAQQVATGGGGNGVNRSHSGSAGRAMAVANPDPVTFRSA